MPRSVFAHDPAQIGVMANLDDVFDGVLISVSLTRVRGLAS
jgi:hypothetical protein